MKLSLKPMLITVLWLLFAAIVLIGCPGGNNNSQTVNLVTSKGDPESMSATLQKSLRDYEEILKVGMSRQEVVEHLGEGRESGNRLIYSLGSRSLGSDTDILTIEFNDNDRLIQYRLSRG
jgi:hypothetical protein